MQLRSRAYSQIPEPFSPLTPLKIMNEKTSRISFKDKVTELLPEGGHLNMCLTCGLCSAGCPASGLEGMDPRKFLRMAALGLDEEITSTPWVWMCTMCERCMKICPMQINIPQLVYQARTCWPKEERPRGIVRSCETALTTPTLSAMGISPEDFRFVVEDVLEEVQETQPGQEKLKAPINKQGAHFYLNQNSREPVNEPDEMVPLWKILDVVGADWTYSDTAWAGETYCMFAANDESWEQVVRTKAERVNELGCKVWLSTECGHEFYAMRSGLKKFNVEHNFEFTSIIQWYAKWIREGKLPVNSDWNRDAKVKFTVQDPCQMVRKTLGDPLADDLRFVVKSIVGEENLIEMWPNRTNNYCCGGGGGSLQSGFNAERRAYGKKKFDQIMATGAPYCITPCHNCHSQIEDLSEYYKGGFRTVHLWTLICLSLGILGENEQTYLGPDLAALA